MSIFIIYYRFVKTHYAALLIAEKLVATLAKHHTCLHKISLQFFNNKLQEFVSIKTWLATRLIDYNTDFHTKILI